MTGNIISNGTEAFTPIIDKLGAIVSEFLPYIIDIAIACLGITLTYKAIKMIVNYLYKKARGVFYYRETDYKQLGKDKNGYNTIQITKSRRRRKTPKWSKIRN